MVSKQFGTSANHLQQIGAQERKEEVCCSNSGVGVGMCRLSEASLEKETC
jgi:hypothetical protein